MDQNDRGDLIDFTPMKNLGRKDGIDYVLDLSFRAEGLDPESLGRGLRRALDLAPIYQG